MQVILSLDGGYHGDLLQLLHRVGIRVADKGLPEFLCGREAVDRGDILLLDLRRSPRQVIDTIKSIRQQLGFGPGIIVMTRRGDVVITLEALEAGADSLTHCPGTDATLVAASIIGLGRLMGVLPQGVRVHQGYCQTDSSCGARP
jgi:FixJ family two-component response regulator